MSRDAIWHRTFIPFVQYANSNCGSHSKKPSHGSRKLKVDFERTRRDLGFPETPSMPSPFGARMPLSARQIEANLPQGYTRHQPDQARFQAVMLANARGKSSFRQITMVEKPGQDFRAHATDWERKYSRLCYVANGAKPVVDEARMVIGHIIRVRGDSILVPVGCPLLSLRDSLAEEIPLFVHKGQKRGWVNWATMDQYMTVLVGVDGEVLAILKQDLVGIESADFWLLDAITIGGAVAKLGARVGSRMIKSLARRSARKAGKAVTTELAGPTAKRAAEAVAKQRAKDADGLVPSRSYIRESGMDRSHFKAYGQAAQDENVIAIVRNTNTNSTPLIERGCPGKPLSVKANTGPDTGVVTTQKLSEVMEAEAAGYFVIHEVKGNVAVVVGRVNGKQVRKELQNSLPGAWKMKPGQVVDMKLQKPLVGDYDLMGVVNVKSMGQNVSLVASHGKLVLDVSGPHVTRFRKRVDPKLDRPRSLHGAQDQFASFRGGATAFMPNGEAVLLRTERDVAKFYERIGRETRKGSYNKHLSPDTPVHDELAARRRR